MNLLYSYSFGDPIYKQLCQEMVYSSRQAGFKGDIVILTDSPWEFEGAKNIVVKVSNGELWRTFIRHVVNLKEYGSIVYSDSDIWWTKNPDLLCGSEKIRVSTSGNPLFTAPLASNFLTQKEKRESKEFGVKGICSGTVVFPGSTSDEFLKQWEERWQSFNFEDVPLICGVELQKELWDEAALQTLIIRNEIEWEHLPLKNVLFPAIPFMQQRLFNPDVIAIHFVGMGHIKGSKNELLEWMKICHNPLAIGVLVEQIKFKAAAMIPKTDAIKIVETQEKMAKNQSEHTRLIKMLLERIEVLEKKESPEWSRN